MPIRLRLGLLFALGVAVVIAVGGFAFEQQLQAGLVSSLGSGLQQRADLLARSVASSGDVSGPGGTAVVPGVLSQVYDPQGAVAASSVDSGHGPLLARAQVAAAQRGALVTNLDTTTEATSDRVGERIRLRAVPVVRPDGIWVAVVGTSLETADNASDRVRRALLFAGVPLVVLAGIAVWLVAGAALAPVERMRRQVAEISEHGENTSIAIPPTRDEIARLAATMNGVLGRLSIALDRQRQFVSDAGHELRTPLTVLQGELELAANPKRSRADLAKTVEAATEEVRRLVDLTENLLSLGQGHEAAVCFQPVVLADVVDAGAESITSHADQPAVTVRCQLDRTVSVNGDATQLRRAVENLIDNALRFAPDASTVSVTVGREDGQAVMEVSDDGPGFPADFLPHAFERFRRADESRSRAGGGTGLGLAIVEQIAIAHGGQAMARNRPEGGAAVRVTLPAATSSP